MRNVMLELTSTTLEDNRKRQNERGKKSGTENMTLLVK
jgi:hypothetical protein